MDQEELNEFNISEYTKNKIKNKLWVKNQLKLGKTIYEIVGFTSETLDKFSQIAFKFIEQNRIEDALNAFIFLTSQNPDNLNYWLGLGMAEQKSHRYEHAIDAYEMAASCQSENPYPYLYLAKCLFALHDRKAAHQAIELAKSLAEGEDKYLEILSEIEKAKKILEIEQ